MTIPNSADNGVAGEPIPGGQGSDLAILPTNESVPGGDPRRSVRIDRQVWKSNFVTGENCSWRCGRSLGGVRVRLQRIHLQRSTRVVTEIAVFEPEPDATRRVGREVSDQRHPIRSDFLLHALVADAEQLAVGG